MVPNFEVGDFFMVRRASSKGHKLQFRWIGPRRVVGVVSELVYDVDDLQGGPAQRIHAARLFPYRSSPQGMEVSEALLKQAEHLETKFEMVDSLMDIDEGTNGIFIHVKWLGLPDKHG